MGELSNIIEMGGATMKVNIFFLIVSVAIFLDRLIAVYFKFNVDGSRFMVQIEKLVASDNIDKAVKLCNAAPKAALARVLRAGLSRSNRGILEIGNAIEEETLAVTPAVMKRISALWSLANVCVLIGLFGTIVIHSIAHFRRSFLSFTVRQTGTCALAFSRTRTEFIGDDAGCTGLVRFCEKRTVAGSLL